MSFDELPSDAPLPASPAGENAASDREASDRDAPPSAPARRRRAPRTGADAASPEPDTTNEPAARATRRSRQPAEEGITEGKREKGKGKREESKAEDSQPSGENTNVNPASTSRRRAAKPAPVNGVADAAPVLPAESETAKTDAPAPASRRRSRRKDGEPAVVATPESAPVAEAAPETENASAAPADITDDAPSAPPARTSRRTRASAGEQGAEEEKGKREKGKGKRRQQTRSQKSKIENRKSKIPHRGGRDAGGAGMRILPRRMVRLFLRPTLWRRWAGNRTVRPRTRF